jgi:hypothetical protein
MVDALFLSAYCACGQSDSSKLINVSPKLTVDVIVSFKILFIWGRGRGENNEIRLRLRLFTPAI